MSGPAHSPAFLEQEFGTVSERIAANARERGAHAALIQDERRVSYRELDVLAGRVAAALQRDGVRPAQAVAVISANSIEYVALYLGALRAGVAVAPLQTGAVPDVLARMLADSGATHVFVDDAAEAAFGAALAAGGAHCVSLGAPRFEAWLAPAGAGPAPVEIRPEMPFNIIYSSGTTGVPKGIVQPHSQRWGHVRRGAVTGYSPDAVTLVSTPLYSNTTLVSVFPTLAFGGTLVLMAKFDAGRFLELAERWRATHAMLVPVQYQRILAHADFEQRDLSSLRCKYSTGAPFPAKLKAETLARWPGELRELYGMTEGGASCTLDARAHPDKLHTVGRPNPGSEFKLIDAEGRELPAGSTGELVGHSPAMMTGYHNQPGKTAEFEWFDASGKRFFRSGDIGRFDADGFLILMDRRKDMIISGGFNIYPSDLEAVLGEHRDVLEAAVAGVPSEAWGETPVAWVMRRAAGTTDARALLDCVNARLGKTQRLADLVLVDELPRNAAGKTLKRELRERYIAEQRHRYASTNEGTRG
jgi:acyl-CoA synthetase (AMP-forming)/AMP-acid ligase II